MERDLVRALRRGASTYSPQRKQGDSGAADAAQLEFAARTGRTVFTANGQDYGRLHKAWMAEGRGHSGIVILSDQRTDLGVRMRALLKLLQDRSAADMVNRVEFLPG